MSFWAQLPAAGGQSAPRGHALRWLTHLGLPGLFCVAVFDSCPIPLPIPGSTDLLLLWLVSHRSGKPWLLVLCAVAGGIVGGYLSWQVGRKGGETALKRRLPARFLDPVKKWARSNPFLAVFLPALLPPPVPLTPFVLASGALGVPARRFLTAFGAARALRYLLVAWLGATYGRHVIRLWSRTLDRWSTPILAIFATLIAAGILFAVVKARRRPAYEVSASSVRETAAD